MHLDSCTLPLFLSPLQLAVPLKVNLYQETLNLVLLIFIVIEAISLIPVMMISNPSCCRLSNSGSHNGCGAPPAGVLSRMHCAWTSWRLSSLGISTHPAASLESCSCPRPRRRMTILCYCVIRTLSSMRPCIAHVLTCELMHSFASG